MNRQMKEVLVAVAGGAILGFVSVLGCIVIFWAQGQTIEIGEKLLDWSWMGYPLGYGTLVGATAALVLALIFVRSGVQLSRDELLWELATQEIRDANELIRDLESRQTELKAENTRLQKDLQQENERLSTSTKQFEQKLDTAQQDNGVAQAEITRLRQKLDTAQQDNVVAQAEITHLGQKLDTTQQDNGVAQAEITRLEQELADAKDS